MRVLFETHPWAFATPGGGERQVIQYAKHLASYDVDVVLHDHWNSCFGNRGRSPFFSCIAGSLHFCKFVRERGLPLVITSSLWVDGETKQLYPIEEIRPQLALADVVVTNSRAE